MGDVWLHISHVAFKVMHSVSQQSHCCSMCVCVCCGGTGGAEPLCFLLWPVVWAVMAALMTASLSQAAALVVRSSQTSVSTSAAAPLQRACDYHNSNRVSIKTFTQESETQIFCVGRLGQISGTRNETCLWFCFIPHWQRWEGQGRLEEKAM